jgi:hypothetical protein
MVSNSFGCAGKPEYVSYASKDPEINATMDYLAGWSVSHERGAGDSYAQVIFTEPTKVRKPIRAIIVLMVKKESKIDVHPATLEGLENDFLSKRLKLKNAKVLSRSRMPLFGMMASDLQFSYRMPENPESLVLKFISLQERIVFFKKGDCFYYVRYVNTDEEFKKFEKNFMHCVQSLQFK